MQEVLGEDVQAVPPLRGAPPPDAGRAEQGPIVLKLVFPENRFSETIFKRI